MAGRLSLLGAGKQTVGAAVWTPLSITGCTLWLDFSDADTLYVDAGTTKVSADGQAVYQANDKSGTGNHAVQATADARPTYKVNIMNSLPALYFDGGDWLNFTVATTGTPTTIFWAGYYAYNTSGAYFGKNNAYSPVIKQNGSAITVRPLGETVDFDVNLGEVNGYKILSIQHVSDGGALTLWSNGVQKASANKVGNLGTFTHLGSNKDAPTESNIYDAGYMLETLIYNSALSGTDITVVETYLNNKWAVYA